MCVKYTENTTTNLNMTLSIWHHPNGMEVS